ESAGLLAGDIVTEANKTSLKATTQLSEIIRNSKPGDKLMLTVLRGKDTKTIEVTLGMRSDLFGNTGPGAVGGAGGGGGGRRRGIDFKGEDGTDGVRVLAVFPQGASAQAGLQVGDVIVAVGKRKVTTLQQVADALRPAATPSKLTVNVK